MVFLATLKNDDAEDSGEEGEEDNAILIREKEASKSENAKATSEKQPTGRIVGIIKRNWRAYVLSPFHCFMMSLTHLLIAMCAILIARP
jgi:hypothetical protein